MISALHVLPVRGKLNFIMAGNTSQRSPTMSNSLSGFHCRELWLIECIGLYLLK